MTRVVGSGWIVALALAMGACSADDPGKGRGCDGDSCDVAADTPLRQCAAPTDFETTTGELACTPCGKVIADRSGRGFVPGFIADDPLVRKVYMTFVDANADKRIEPAEIDCPLEMPAIIAKMRKTDTNGGQPCDDNVTRVVSETAAPLGRAKASYRAVTSRDCDDRPGFMLLFSSFGFRGDAAAKGTGVHISDDGHPGEVEIIAFDPSEGVFNFYKQLGGQMRFFGSSLDFTVAGPGGPGLTSTRGCANCHPGGGLNMKELQGPWTHWSLQDQIDGAEDLVASRSWLGRLGSGSELQRGIVEPGNQAWNRTKAGFYASVTTEALEAARSKLRDDAMKPAERADIERRQLKKRLSATQAMLEPLFCSIQVNIQASGKFLVPGQLFAAGRNGIEFTGFIDSDEAAFDAALAPLHSRVPGVPGKTELTTAFMMVERSHEDADYIIDLLSMNVIDRQFASDVLMVNFTRPVFSDDRCGLLALVPDLPPAERKLPALRDAIIDSLTQAGAAAGTPAGQLLAHLEASKAGQPFDHPAALQAYADTCAARPVAELLRDGLKLRSLQRKLAYPFDGALDDAGGVGAHPFAVFEFGSTMPADDVVVTTTATPDAITEVHPEARWSPIDCTLVSKYLPPAAPAAL